MTLLNLLFLNLGGGEVFLILAVVLLFFGSKNIPELAKGLGKGMREFKDAMAGIENEVKNAANETTPPVKKIDEAPVVAKVPEQSVAKAAEIPSTESPTQTDYDNQPKGN